MSDDADTARLKSIVRWSIFLGLMFGTMLGVALSLAVYAYAKTHP